MYNLWWKSVPSARLFVNDIAERVLNGESVVYTIDSTFPWRDCFVDNLSQKIESASKAVRIIRASDCESTPPGEYLIKSFCKPELRAKYRPSVGTEMFLANYAENTVLIDNYIMIVDCTSGQAQQWNDFISNYNAAQKKYPDRESCCFILENKEENSISLSVSNISWTKYYHSYDIYMLCLMIASELNTNSLMKSYIAELAVLLCNKDVEFAAKLSMDGLNLIKKTTITIKRIIDDSRRSDGSYFLTPDSIRRKTWEAQLKVFFPILEKFRSDFIEKYADAFPTNICLETAYGETITNIHDLELGALIYLCSSSNLHVNSDDYKKLAFFRTCRNKLAHMSALASDEIQQIICYLF